VDFSKENGYDKGEEAGDHQHKIANQLNHRLN
jgi:hypothetical protein